MRDATQTAADAVTSILHAAELLRGLLAADFGELGVNSARYEALQMIADSSPAGCSQSQLAAELNQSESSVSGLVSRMRADGLLYRLRSKQDQRKRLLMLSTQGRSLLDDCETSRRQQMARLVERLETSRLEQLSAQLGWLMDGLAKPDAGEPLRRSA